MSQPLNVVSLFAGAGGSSTGYEMAGCKVLAASEFIAATREAYSANHPDTIMLPQDIRDLSGRDFLDVVGLGVGDLDILDGSPPCASFSTAGNMSADWGKTKKYSDTKQRTDDLFFEYIRMIDEIKPKVFVAENVKGLTVGPAKDEVLGTSAMSLFGDHELTILHKIRAIGYRVAYKVLDAVDYGVPQYRRRVIIIGARDDIGWKPTHPSPTVDQHITLTHAFEDITNTDEDLRKADISRYAVGERLAQIPRDLSRIIRYNQIFPDTTCYFQLARMSPYYPSYTICASVNLNPMHWEYRRFTVPEMKAIMSFPQSYILTGSYARQTEQLGRAVAPLMAKAVAEHITKHAFRKGPA